MIDVYNFSYLILPKDPGEDVRQLVAEIYHRDSLSCAQH